LVGQRFPGTTMKRMVRNPPDAAYRVSVLAQRAEFLGNGLGTHWLPEAVPFKILARCVS
jgi:hypothetical protein